MRKLLNTLFILTEDHYLSLDRENVVVNCGKEEVARFPLHTLENILCFSYKGASPALMGKCSRDRIGLSFFTPRGQFLTRCWGENNGNVLLRKEQYRRSDNLEESCLVARQMILGKVYNSRWVLLRGVRDHALRLEVEPLQRSAHLLKNSLREIQICSSLERLRGLEGEASSTVSPRGLELSIDVTRFSDGSGSIEYILQNTTNAPCLFSTYVWIDYKYQGTFHCISASPDYERTIPLSGTGGGVVIDPGENWSDTFSLPGKMLARPGHYRFCAENWGLVEFAVFEDGDVLVGKSPNG